jgi:hypothetical protein
LAGRMASSAARCFFGVIAFSILTCHISHVILLSFLFLHKGTSLISQAF